MAHPRDQITQLLDDGVRERVFPGAVWAIGDATARHLLTHTTGMPLRANLKHLYGTAPRTVRDGVLREALHRPIGEAVNYTDRASLVLGYLAEHLSGRPLDHLARHRVWQPLGMNSTRFGPLPAALIGRYAPTELDPGTGAHLKGVVHDFSARLLNGVCGIAGVFAAADDLGSSSATSWPPPPERIRSVSEPPGWPSPSRSTPAT
ncbi:serine hydrolase domain-containing protein [Streptosporangium canum]|uniref:serine hydrolase domain-containing protein n=1 Tax=Streptosporangium canum TaxID=324952 RepID=UPI0034263706